MSHTHDFQTVERVALSAGARDMGLTGCEVRRCKECGREMTFISDGDKWVELYDTVEASGKDVLMA